MVKASPNEGYLVLRDTGEHKGKGWQFNKSEDCAGTVERNLYTADYSLEGYYDSKIFVIERKGSVSEFVANLTQKEKWDDFKDELERMEEFRYPYLILEFPFSVYQSYPVGSGIPKHLWKYIKAKPKFLIRRLAEIELTYKTRVLFLGSHAKVYVNSLFKRIIEKVPNPCEM